MKAAFYTDQINQVLKLVREQRSHQAESVAHLNAKKYLDQDLLQKEKALFRRTPIIVGHSSELAKPGDFFVREINGRSWLLTKAKDGSCRAFLNYCQHRGTKLVHTVKGENTYRFSCPYHAWTYDCLGSLIGVPRADLFPGLDKSQHGLRTGLLQEAYGLLWLTEQPEDDKMRSIDDFLGGLRDEFEQLSLDQYHLYYDHTRSLKANWKFPIFAFLESYHLAVLHKDSIGEFFIDNIAYTERLGLHFRSFVPRANALELEGQNFTQINISDYITPTNIMFPNVCMISHPTSLSILTMFPGDTPDTSTWRHMLLTPSKPETEKQIAHYDKTIAVLDKMTYEKEDFWVSEQIQEGINAGAIERLLLGKTEHLIAEFDQLIEQHL